METQQDDHRYVITHDLSQIESGDFVYVLKDGRVVEQGFRCDLESVSEEEDGRGEFRKMMEQLEQSQTGGFLPEKDVAVVATVDMEDILKQQEEEEEVELNEKNEKYALPAHLKHKSIAIRPLSLGNWMFDVVAVQNRPLLYHHHHRRLLLLKRPDIG